MSTPSWKRKDNTYCKYCQQWIRDTPSEKRNHERSKHHVINVQKYISNQQILERNKQKEEQRTRKIIDNIERKVQSGSNDGENHYYQAFLKHQQEMEKLPSVVMENVFHTLTNQQQTEDIPHSEEPPQQHDEIHEAEPSDSFECNDLPLGFIAQSKPIEAKVTPKISAPKKKTYNEPTEIGNYYDDPNFFYYEQEEKEEEKKEEEENVNEEVVSKEKPKTDWKSQFSNATTASANTFGQWEIVKVSNIETTSTEITRHSEPVVPVDYSHQTKDEHEEDQFGGSYNLSDTKKRKNETMEESSKKVKTESAPRKPMSFSLAKKK